MTTRTSTTLGPWTYRRIGPRRGPVRLTDKTFVIVPQDGPVFAYLPEGRDDIQEANARLIAAAPEMREFIQAVVAESCFSVHEDDHDGPDEPRCSLKNPLCLNMMARALLARINGK